jgi:hypothetical protein
MVNTEAGTAMQLSVLSVCCRTRQELAEEFAVAARLFSEAVVSLAGHIGGMSDGEFNRLRTAAKTMQERAEAARVAFEEHVDSHRCALTSRRSQIASRNEGGSYLEETADDDNRSSMPAP